MFEHTLAGSMPRERSFRFGPVSAAVVIHAGVLVAVVAVSWLTFRPIKEPEIPVIFDRFQIQPIIEERPAVQTPAPRAGGGSENRSTLAQPPPVTPPEAVPDKLIPVDPIASVTMPDLPVENGGSSLTTGLPGIGDGSGNGPGTGDGSDPIGNGPGGGDGTGSGPIALGPGIASPRLVFKVQPDYPPIARKSRLEGDVVLRAVVGPDGNVTAVEVVRSSNPMFNDAAISAVRQWRYTPPSQNGRPVSVWLDVMVKFTLR